MTCGKCRYFTPDAEGYGGIGKCAQEVEREGTALVYHKGQVEIHRQQALPYPGQQSCQEFIDATRQ